MGVSVSYDASIGQQRLKGTVATGKDGTVTIEYPSDAKISMFEVTATLPGHVPIFMRWDRFGKPATIPAFKELRFEPGTAIGGVVKDERGKPVIGAAPCTATAPPTEYEGARVVFMVKGPTDRRTGPLANG